jgi:membrane glycosyltransferase
MSEVNSAHSTASSGEAADDLVASRDRFGGLAAATARPPLPPIDRISMAPKALERRLGPRLRRKLFQRASRNLSVAPPRTGWRNHAARRRIALTILVAAQTALATWSLARTFPYAELTYLQWAILGLFAVLFSWISFSFWSNIAGFGALWRKTKVIDGTALGGVAAPLRARTAVLMPICEEDARRCFRAIEAMCRSLRSTGEGEKFDFFVLSDTATAPRQLEEENEWRKTCRALDGIGKVFYRRRKLNIKRKSGNVADFLRRWSRSYEYMIVLDADSIMTGAAMVGLARTMEASPQVGILQSTPTIVNGETLFARMQQFASRVYGPLFAAGLQFWQLGESYYWGHNAILRIAPFVRHCGLARLPGQAPLGGEILSHDFVEAALMARAGYEVWLAPDLPGSYEESPPSVLDELKRDRRWCQGNLQHFRLLFAEGFQTGHRGIFALGIMAYVSALFWAGFLVLNTIELTAESLVVPNYFSSQPSLFPTWPQWHPEWAIALASTTALLLFLPKLLSFILIAKWGAAARFGGPAALAASILLEILISTLLAPSRMWLHTKFVLLTLLGRTIKWNAQHRVRAAGTSWGEAAHAHGAATLVACVWITGVYWISATAVVWLLPIAIPLLLAIPLSVCSSRTCFGRAARRCRLFMIPEERFAPPVLDDLQALMAAPEEAHVKQQPAPSEQGEDPVSFCFDAPTSTARARPSRAPEHGETSSTL